MAENMKHHECEEHPEWIFTFADLVMLMMGFFVILWVLKPSMAGAAAESGTKEREQWEATVASVRESFGYVPDASSGDPIDLYMLSRQRPAEDGSSPRQPAGVKGNQENSMIRPSPDVGVGGAILFGFESGSFDAAAETRLDELAKVLRGYNMIVHIKGHAAKDEALSVDAMELSSRRATAVRDALIKRGLSADALRVVVCGAYEPLHRWSGSNPTYALNRRVEIEVTKHLVSDFTDRGDRQAPVQP